MTGWKRAGFLAVVIAVVIGGCETSFEPFVEGEQYFTVMGYLDSAADTQFVRVVPVRRVLDRSQPVPIDAAVVTTDLTTGEQVAWRDSLFQFRDSTYGHVFWAAFRPEPEHRYRIEVQRSDGATTTAETTLPPLADTAGVHSVLNRGPFFQPLIWPGVTNVIDVDVRYIVQVTAGPPTELFIRYVDDDRGSLRAEGWWAEFHLAEDKKTLNDLYVIPGDDPIPLYSLSMRIAVPSADWQPPGGLWDPNVLVQPGTFSNVMNGLGFWGSVTRTCVEHQLDSHSMYVLGYAPAVLPPGD